MTRRRWIADTWDQPLTTGSHAVLEGDQAVHLARVLRAQVGTEYDIVTGNRVWQAEIATVSESEVTFRLIAELPVEETLSITVLLSIFKFDRLEWAIEKLTELGVSTIQPVVVRRTEKHLAQAAGKRVERWRKIAVEAAKQSRRTSLPEIPDPLALKEAIGSYAANFAVRLLLSENEKQQSMVSALKQSERNGGVILAIGPEGGWAPEEESLFAEHNWTSVMIGSTILRAETAAIAAVAIASANLNG